MLKLSTANDPITEPNIEAFRMFSSFIFLQLDKYPITPPAKESPAPVGSIGVFIGFIIALIQIISQKAEIISLKSTLRKANDELDSLRNQDLDDDIELVDDENLDDEI